MLPLTHARAWIAASLVLVALVVYGSLATGPQVPVPGEFDKLQHFGAYAFLAVWFAGLVMRRRFVGVAVGLAALGLALEYLQYAMQAGRYGDPLDLAANLVGIAAGLALGQWRAHGWALRVEAWLNRN